MADRPHDPDDPPELSVNEGRELRHVESQRLDRPDSAEIVRRGPTTPPPDPALQARLTHLERQLRRYRRIWFAVTPLFVVLVIVILVLAMAGPSTTSALPRGSGPPSTPSTASSAPSSRRPPGVSSSRPPAVTTSASANASGAAGSPTYITDLSTAGANWIEGTWLLGGISYEHSLASTNPCGSGPEFVKATIPPGYQHFSATVGVDDNATGDIASTVEFRLYVDTDNDGKPGQSELVASRGGVRGNPGHINASINGATHIILLTELGAGDCLDGAMVWGDPQVF